MADDVPGSDDWEPFEEEVDGTSPGDATVGRDGGGAVLSYQCLPDELEDRIAETLETVEQDERGADGGLRRTLPLAHPVFPWFYAEKISAIKGHGEVEKADAGSEWLEAPGPEFYAKYSFLTYRIQFSPRPYAVLTDESIDSEDIEWFNDDGDIITTPCAQEWKRYCVLRKGDVDIEVVAQTFGGMKLRLGGDTDLDKQLTAMPSMILPKSSLIVTHVCVPMWWHYNEAASSGALVGKVNQIEYFGYRPGTLLLQKVTTTAPYAPPLPRMEYDEIFGSIVQDRCVDASFHFALASRSPEVEIHPTNGNFIADGHNTAFSGKDRKCYYLSTVGSPDSAEEGIPPFKSGVMQFLHRSPIG